MLHAIQQLWDVMGWHRTQKAEGAGSRPTSARVLIATKHLVSSLWSVFLLLTSKTHLLFVLVHTCLSCYPFLQERLLAFLKKGVSLIKVILCLHTVFMVAYFVAI